MSRRQDIIDAFKTRMESIKVSGGYYSNLGASIHEWRDMDNSPFAFEELPALNFKDPEEDIITEVISLWSHYMTLELEVYCTHKSDVGKECRKLINDIIVAVGTDYKWSTLAETTDFESTPGGKHLNIKIETNEKNIARATFKLVILYRTSYWTT